MSRQERKLSARTVASWSKFGRLGDGGGLFLFLGKDGSRRWIYQFTFGGKPREMGLGNYPLISLAEARELRDRWRDELKAGRNPIEVRRTETTRSATPTFGEVASEFIEAKTPGWRSAKHAAQWATTLEVHAQGLWARPIDQIDLESVLAVLKPIWQRTPETASRLRGRVEAVLDAAKVKGFRSGENPATWKGNLAHILPKRGKLSRGHHAALPYRDVPSFIERLHGSPSPASMALEFAILTAGRIGEVLGATCDEIDLDARVWTIPANKMKAGIQHIGSRCRIARSRY
jgi:integrase